MLSFRENIPIILKVIEEKNPKKILDVGAGMGKYGLLIREQYLSKKAETGEIEPIDDIIIDAVEDTKYFLTNRLKTIYNRVFEEDIFNLKVDNYDLILMVDTIEHWEREKTMDLLKALLEKAPILISTPKRIGMYKQCFYGDKRHHITQYKESDFNEFKIEITNNPLSHIIYIKRPDNPINI